MAKGLLPPWFRININNSASSSSSSNSSSSNNPNEEEEEEEEREKEVIDTDLRLGLSNYVRRRRGDHYVKVYMDGYSIGRSINLSEHHSYDDVVATVRTMFTATLLWPYVDQYVKNAYILTYEDNEADWMMFGDVPWEWFLKTVKKLRISKSRGNN